MTLMNDIFREYLDRFVIVYIDDILVYSKNLQDHLLHLEQVLQKLQQHRLFGKLSKCEFAKEAVDFLGHVVSSLGLTIDQHKIESIRTWPIPTNLHELHSFLGLATYYRHFVKRFSQLTSPLTDLLHKERVYDWQPEQENAFNAIKEALISTPVLLLPDPEKSYVVTTDASDFAVGAVLSQDQGKGEQPIAFESRKMSPAERNYPVHEKELLAIIHALKTWRIYLEDHPFEVITDHASLEYLATQSNLSRRQTRWVELLQSYDFIVRYRPGRTNTVADALSRRADLKAITTIEADIGKRIAEGYSNDEYFGPILTVLQE